MELSDLANVSAAGYQFADYETFLNFYKEKYRSIFGTDVYIEADSLDGQFIAILAKAAYDNASLIAQVVNAISPATAQGVPLAQLVLLNGIKKNVATKSTVDLTIVGQVGTVISNGIAIDTLQQKWNLPAIVTIPSGGQIVVTATAQDVGNVKAAANTVNRIFTATRGWQNVTNQSEATEGVPVETDAELRIRQSDSVAVPSKTVFDGTIGAIKDLDGVSKVRGYENDNDSTDANGIPAHSVAIIAKGGDTTNIAEKIATHKTPGTGTFGTTEVTIYDSEGMPNIIKFSRPVDVRIFVEIVLSAAEGWVSSYSDSIKKAVSDYINKNNIGDIVYYSKLYIPAYLLGTPANGTFNIASIRIKLDGEAFEAENIILRYNDNAVCTVDDVLIIGV